MDDSFASILASYWNRPEIAANIIVFLNIIGALMLGLVVGYERSYRGRAAGMRTYGMVSMASCALVIACGFPTLWWGQTFNPADFDPGRVIQGIVTGVGFIGAGVIMRDGLNISGLTTAASIWLTSAIGVLVGVGFYGAAILLTFAAVLMMWGARFEGFLPKRHAIAVTIRFREKSALPEAAVRDLMLSVGYTLARGSFSISEHGGRAEWKFVGLSTSSGDGDNLSLIGVSQALSKINEIETYSLSHARN